MPGGRLFGSTGTGTPTLGLCPGTFVPPGGGGGALGAGGGGAAAVRRAGSTGRGRPPLPWVPDCWPSRARRRTTAPGALAARCARGRRLADDACPDLAVGLGGVGELHLVVRGDTRDAPGVERNGLLVHPGPGERHEELAHVRRQPLGGLGVVGLGAREQLQVESTEQHAGVVDGWLRRPPVGSWSTTPVRRTAGWRRPPSSPRARRS